MQKRDPLSQMLQKDAGKTMLERINERYHGCPHWNVMVLVDGNSPEMHTVRADSKDCAQTLAMLMYTQDCNGKLVEYYASKLS